MNERIKELAEQAGMEYHSEHQFDAFSEEKFAELIIRECAEISWKHWMKHKDCSAHFSIREHFGVEE